MSRNEIVVDWPKRGHSYVESDLEGLDELLLGVESLTTASNVTCFEQEFSKKFNLGSSYATMSCAHALDIIGKVTIRSPDDEVVLPAHTYCATAIGFGRAGAKLVWADIDPGHLTITFEEVVRLTNKNTRAIVVVHLYGLICPDISKIVKFAREKGIVVVEDCAQCIGANVAGSYAGSFGDFATFSFHAQKNMTTFGEGGMLTVNCEGFDEKIRAMRLNGHLAFENQEQYWLPAMTNVTSQHLNSWPMKATLTEAQALIGRNVLKRLSDMNKKRKKLANQIVTCLENYEEIQFQSFTDEPSHCNHLLPIRLKSKRVSRDAFMDTMFSEFGIKCVTQYYPLYRYELFSTKGFSCSGLTETDVFYDNMISLPFCHETSQSEAQYMCESIKTSLERY